jgi:hypothetical protein
MQEKVKTTQNWSKLQIYKCKHNIKDTALQFQLEMYQSILRSRN